MASNQGKVKYNVQRIFLTIGGLFFLVLLLSAIERKERSDSVDLVIEIQSQDDTNFITKEDVKNMLKRRFGHVLNGIPVGSLDVQEVEEVLEKDAFVKKADVFIGARNTVNIRIMQRKPILRVIDGDGASFYLDEEGHFLPLSANYTARVPVATGVIPTFRDDFMEFEGNVVKGLFEIVTYARQDEFLWPMLEQIAVDKKKEFVLIPKLGKQKIVFGKAVRITEKFENLKAFYKEGIPYEGWKKYKTINLKFRGQVVCKKK